jgi:alpha-D-ribose 1-methylphosphonate 5-triphosphate diphosphatase
VLRAIVNARVVTREQVLEGATIVLEEGRIAGITHQTETSGETLDAAGRYVLPGLVDLHSDAIEKQLAPRPGVEFSPETAFVEMDRYFVSSGITTGFHALSLMEGKGRNVARSIRLCEVVALFRGQGLARHELHLRCELPEEGAISAAEKILKLREVGIVSMMDHTPGQGQFRDLEWFRRYWVEDRGMDEAQVSEAIARAGSEDHGLALDRVRRIARASKDGGTVLASHDDDTPERVELLAEHGVRISEFPVNAESARRAKELGLSVCMGAPNVVRGRSSGGNLDATEATKLGLVDALCSDYHPPSMLQAIFKMAEKRILSLPRAVNLVSAGPALAAGLSDRGEIREGALADLMLVGERVGLAAPTHLLVGGNIVAQNATPALSPAGTGRDVR